MKIHLNKIIIEEGLEMKNYQNKNVRNDNTGTNTRNNQGNSAKNQGDMRNITNRGDMKNIANNDTRSTNANNRGTNRYDMTNSDY